MIMPRVRLFLRVLYPLVSTPQGLTGCCPAAVFPSPPPCGWSIGFIATPRTVGRTPRQRTRPAYRARRRDESDRDRKSTRLNSSHVAISYAVFCLKKKKKNIKKRIHKN